LGLAFAGGFALVFGLAFDFCFAFARGRAFFFIGVDFPFGGVTGI
jgi:hypothetical protein